MKFKEIKLKQPFIKDITEIYRKQLSKFDSFEDYLKVFKSIGFDKILYDGIKRYGMDSSTDCSDIKITDLKVGDELFYRKHEGVFKMSWDVVKITHKYSFILFFQSLKTGDKSYVDTGADDKTFKKSKSRGALPKHMFYPIELIKPTFVDISSFHHPRQMIITNVEI